MSHVWPYWLKAQKRKLLSRAVHFTLHSDQRVTSADCVSLGGGLVRLILLCRWKTELKLILKIHHKQLRWATDGSIVGSGGVDIKVFTVESTSWLMSRRRVSMLDSSFMAVTKCRQKYTTGRSHGEWEVKIWKQSRCPNWENYNKSSNNSGCCCSHRLHTSQHANSSQQMRCLSF